MTYAGNAGPGAPVAATALRSDLHSAVGDRLDWIHAGEHPPQEARPRPRFALTILDRYVLLEVVPPFLFAAVAFALFSMVNQLILAADYLINKGVPFDLIARYLVLQLPAFAYVIFPFGGLFATLWAFGRLVGDNEVSALRTSGVSMHRIAAPCYILGAVLAVAAFLINEYIAPNAVHKSMVVFRQIAYHSSQPIIPPNQFIHTEDGQHIIYVNSIDPSSGQMHGIAIYTLGRGGYYPEVLTAAYGQQVNGKVVLGDGVDTIYKPNGLVDHQTTFATMDFPLADTNLLTSASLTAFEMNSNDLRKKLQAERGAGFDVRQDEMVLHQKYAMPVASLICILVALPLAVRFGKHGRVMGAVLSVVVVIVYYLVMITSFALGKNGAVPPVLAAWGPNILAGTAGLFLILQEER